MMRIIMANIIIPPNTEPITMPAISPPVSSSDSDPASVAVGVTLDTVVVADVNVPVIEIDVVGGGAITAYRIKTQRIVNSK